MCLDGNTQSVVTCWMIIKKLNRTVSTLNLCDPSNISNKCLNLQLTICVFNLAFPSVLMSFVLLFCSTCGKRASLGSLWSSLDLASPSFQLRTGPPLPTCPRSITPLSASSPSTKSHSSTLKRRVSHPRESASVPLVCLSSLVIYYSVSSFRSAN